MPAFDIQYDTTPANRNSKPRGPSIANLKSALSTFSSTSYTAARMNGMSKNDLISACTVHSLAVPGL